MSFNLIDGCKNQIADNLPDWFSLPAGIFIF